MASLTAREAVSVTDFMEPLRISIFIGLLYLVQRCCISPFLACRSISSIFFDSFENSTVLNWCSLCQSPEKVPIYEQNSRSLLSSVLASKQLSLKESSWVTRSVLKILGVTPAVGLSYTHTYHSYTMSLATTQFLKGFLNSKWHDEL